MKPKIVVMKVLLILLVFFVGIGGVGFNFISDPNNSLHMSRMFYIYEITYIFVGFIIGIDSFNVVHLKKMNLINIGLIIMLFAALFYPFSILIIPTPLINFLHRSDAYIIFSILLGYLSSTTLFKRNK